MHTPRIKQFVLAAGCALLLQSGWLWAAESSTTPVPPAPPPQSWMNYGAQPSLDWVQHTQRMLDDLKTKLNLTGDQKDAWEAWSGTVLANVRAQSEKIEHWRDEHMKQGPMMDPAHSHLTTPERMERGLEHMRTEIKRMQDHVALLEKALASTKVFYVKLGPDQKTIFDLYWQQSYQGGLTGHGMGHGMEHGMEHGMMEHGMMEHEGGYGGHAGMGHGDSGSSY